MSRTDRPGAMVLGLGFSGVGALHSLNELSPRPNPIVGIDENHRAVGFASRVGTMHVAPAPWLNNGADLCSFLLSMADSAGCRFVVYPCGDDYVRFVSENREKLQDSFLFLMPNSSTLESILDKSVFANAARQHGVDSPACAVVDAAPGLTLPEGFRLPLVAKSLTSLHSDPFWGIIRVKQFDTLKEWDSFFEPYRDHGHKVMIQELVVGGERNHYVYEGLWSAESEEICGFTAQKLRQQPRNYGSSCRAVATLEPDVLTNSRKLLKALGYVGLADVDYKRDERDGRIMVMEINPRLGGIHRGGRSCGIDLVQTYYRHVMGEPVTPGRQVAGVKGQWCHLSKDLRGLLLDLKDNPARLFPWLGSYFSFPKDALFNWRDPGPWFAGLWRLVCAVFKVMWRGVRRGGAQVLAGSNGVSNSLTVRDE